jgi:uncharacterized protein (TIGR02302 family)
MLGAVGLALLGSLVPLARTPWPTREEALRRMERASGLQHRPASSYEDNLTANAADPASRRLWDAHRERLARLLSRLRPGPPKPRTERFDPLALRALLMLALLLLFVATGERTYDRLVSPFRLGGGGAIDITRLDAWVTPPLYTGRPPIMLADGGKSPSLTSQTPRIIEAPQGSILVVRATGDGHARFRVDIVKEGGVLEKVAPVGAPPASGANAAQPAIDMSGINEVRLELKRDTTIKVTSGGREIATWAFSVIPDHPPKISLTKDPETTPRGALRLAWKAEDDYGVASAQTRFARTDAEGTTEGGQAAPKDPAVKRKPRPPLERPPRIELRLPKSDGKVVEGKAFGDLTSHIWAGLPVRMWLEARDQAGQLGKSEPVEMLLPERRFTKLLARAVVEQRRELAADVGNRDKVALALQVLTIAPELYFDDRAVYLGLRSAYWRLKHDKTRMGARSVMSQLWHIALRIEDGNLSDAERALRDAQERLSKAIEDGASDEELQKLMQELRQALSKFLEALQQQAERNGDMQQPGDGDERTVTSRDLEQMLRNLEQMARSGSRDAAQQMLSELRDLLEQLQSGRMAQNGRRGQGGNQMMQMMDQFGELIQKQQRLLDDTYEQQGAEQGQRGEGQQGQGQRQRRQQGQQGQPGQRGQRQPGQQGEAQQGQPGGDQQGQGSLRDRQGQLRDQLGRMMNALRGMGLNPPDQMGRAADAMNEAERALGRSDLDRATEQEAQALDQLRQGAQQMAEQIMRQMAGRAGRNAPNMDPLGRPQSTHGPDPGLSVKIPDQIDTQRAREILEELRKRLSDPNRPMLELDYIERLLKRF